MEFSLLNQKVLNFYVNPGNLHGLNGIESRRSLATLQLTHLPGPNSLDEVNFGRFLSIFQGTARTQSSKTNSRVIVEVALGSPPGSYNCNVAPPRPYIKLQPDEPNPGCFADSVLVKLQRAATQAQCLLKIKIEIRNWRISQSVNGSVLHPGMDLRTMEIPIEDFIASRLNPSNGIDLYTIGIMNGWTCSGPRSNWVGTFTVTGILSSKNLSIPVQITEENPPTNKRILLNEVQPDLIIRADGNVDIKAHRAFLCVYSSVFRTMFQRSSKEYKFGMVVMTDMSEVAVRAFLAFLYYSDVKVPDESCVTAFELLKAGHKYDVHPLETKMQSLFLEKGESWFTVEVAMQLFLYSRNLEHLEPLKMKSVSVLKKNYKELLRSASYAKMFDEDRAATMELCQLAFSV